MNSIEKITSRIMGEAEEYAAETIKNAKERAGGIISEAKQKAEAIKSSYVERAEKESLAVINRAASSADILERNILLDAKSVIIDGVFEKAKVSFSEVDKGRYFDFLVKMLRTAAVSLTMCQTFDEEEAGEDKNETFVLTLNAVDTAVYGEKLVSSLKKDLLEQNKKMEISDTPGDFLGGLKLRLGNIEVSGTLDTLLRSLKEKKEAEIYSILFR